MKSTLDIEARRALLNEAATVRRRLERKTAAEAATALAILLRDGLGALKQALDPSIRAELGASTKYWLDFRREVAAAVNEIAKLHGPVGTAFFLGWLKRLDALSEPSGLKAGDVVEAVLVEERTKKGGWKARHRATGLTGPIVNSDAVPSDRAPGDTVTLVIASVGRREVAFRYSDEAPATGRKRGG